MPDGKIDGKIDKFLILLDIGILAIPALLTLGTVLLFVDVFNYIYTLGIIEKNVFNAFGVVAIMLFYSFRVWIFFEGRIKCFRRSYVFGQERKEMQKNNRQVDT